MNKLRELTPEFRFTLTQHEYRVLAAGWLVALVLVLASVAVAVLS